MESLKKNESFQAVYKKGKSAADRNFVIYVLKNNFGYNRLGISVSKKVGNSIVRHRLARLIRESYRLHEKMFNSGLDIVVVARINSKDIKKCAEVCDSILHISKKLNIYYEKNSY